ncbi:hypothetical protein Efla_002382 [Eimeria flavescens]
MLAGGSTATGKTQIDCVVTKGRLRAGVPELSHGDTRAGFGCPGCLAQSNEPAVPRNAAGVLKRPLNEGAEQHQYVESRLPACRSFSKYAATVGTRAVPEQSWRAGVPVVSRGCETWFTTRPLRGERFMMEDATPYISGAL